MPDAFTVRRFVAALVAPSAIVTVPDDTVCDADVVDVKVANVPRLAMPAATPRAPNDKSTFFDVLPKTLFMLLPFASQKRLVAFSRADRSFAKCPA
jgi:hypothetical protein